MFPGDEKSVDGIIGRPDGLPACDAQHFAGATTAEARIPQRRIEGRPSPDSTLVKHQSSQSFTVLVHDNRPPTGVDGTYRT
jgi:hypothetical protein